jgi:hypothetical protein
MNLSLGFNILNPINEFFYTPEEILFGEIKKMNIVSDGENSSYFIILRGGGKEQIFIPKKDWSVLNVGDHVHISRNTNTKTVSTAKKINTI